MRTKVPNSKVRVLVLYISYRSNFEDHADCCFILCAERSPWIFLFLDVSPLGKGLCPLVQYKEV